jgi:hypothetical protein
VAAIRRVRGSHTVLIAVSALAAAMRAGAQTPQRFSLDDLGRMSTPVSTAISPDGRRVAYSFVTPDSAGTGYVRRIHVVGTDGGVPERLTGVRSPGCRVTERPPASPSSGYSPRPAVPLAA